MDSTLIFVYITYLILAQHFCVVHSCLCNQRSSGKNQRSTEKNQRSTVKSVSVEISPSTNGIALHETESTWEYNDNDIVKLTCFNRPNNDASQNCQQLVLTYLEAQYRGIQFTSPGARQLVWLTLPMTASKHCTYATCICDQNETVSIHRINFIMHDKAQSNYLTPHNTIEKCIKSPEKDFSKNHVQKYIITRDSKTFGTNTRISKHRKKSSYVCAVYVELKTSDGVVETALKLDEVKSQILIYKVTPNVKYTLTCAVNCAADMALDLVNSVWVTRHVVIRKNNAVIKTIKSSDIEKDPIFSCVMNDKYGSGAPVIIKTVVLFYRKPVNPLVYSSLKLVSSGNRASAMQDTLDEEIMPKPSAKSHREVVTSVAKPAVATSQPAAIPTPDKEHQRAEIMPKPATPVAAKSVRDAIFTPDEEHQRDSNLVLYVWIATPVLICIVIVTVVVYTLSCKRKEVITSAAKPAGAICQRAAIPTPDDEQQRASSYIRRVDSLSEERSCDPSMDYDGEKYSYAYDHLPFHMHIARDQQQRIRRHF